MTLNLLLLIISGGTMMIILLTKNVSGYYEPLASRDSNCTNPLDFECISGDCISRNKVCDDKNDCPGRDDEDNCGKNLANLRGKMAGIY